MAIQFWIFFFLILVASVIARGTGKKGQTASLLFIGGVMFFFFAFRIGFTPDYYGYETWFNSEAWYGIDLANFKLSQEPLFSLMAAFLSYRVGLIIQTFLCCVCLYIVLKKYIPVEYWPAAICLMFLYNLFMLGNFSGYRSSYVTVAFTIALLLRKKSFAWFIFGAILIAVSSLIHQSGLVMLVPYLICTQKPYDKKKYYLYLVLSGIAIIIMYTQIQMLNLLAVGMVEENFQKFEAYMYDMSSDRSVHLTSLIYIFLFFYTSFCLKERLTKTEHICVFQTCIFIMLNIMPQIGMISRFQFYFMFPAAIGAIAVFRYSRNQILGIVYAASWAYVLFRSLYLFLPSPLVARTYALYENILFM